MTTCFSIIFVKACEKPESFRLYMDSLKTIPQNIVVKLKQTTYCDIWEQDVGGSSLFTPTIKRVIQSGIALFIFVLTDFDSRYFEYE